MRLRRVEALLSAVDSFVCGGREGECSIRVGGSHSLWAGCVLCGLCDAMSDVTIRSTRRTAILIAVCVLCEE